MELAEEASIEKGREIRLKGRQLRIIEALEIRNIEAEFQGGEAFHSFMKRRKKAQNKKN